MIAKEVEIPVIIVPRESSVFCAAGMLFSDLKHDFVRTYTMSLDRLDLKEISRRYEEMKSAAHETLKSENIPADRIRIEYSADIRYVGQFNEVEVPVSFESNLEEAHVREMAEEFHKKHDQLYGYSLPGADLEFINIRIAAHGITEKPVFKRAVRMDSSIDVALKGNRDAFFEGKFMNVPVYDGLKMGYGHTVGGPCIVEQPTTTIIVPNEYALGCDEYNNYVMFHLELASQEIKSSFGGYDHG
jgi:N-methylhydantoinase A